MNEKPKQLKFSEALARIQEIAEKIDKGEIEIDDLADRVKEAYELHAICKTKIEEADLQIQKIIRSQEAKEDKEERPETTPRNSEDDEGLPF